MGHFCHVKSLVHTTEGLKNGLAEPISEPYSNTLLKLSQRLNSEQDIDGNSRLPQTHGQV